MKLLALFFQRLRSFCGVSHRRAESDHGPRRGGATFLRLLVAFALVGVVGTAAAFKGGALPGPAGVSYGTIATYFCALTGCTMTGQTVYSGVTTDITTGTDENLNLAPNGTGKVQIKGSSIVQYYTQPAMMGLLASIPAANTVLGTFTTGAAATLDRMDVTAGYLNGTAGTGTGTMDITTTAGTSVCAVTVDCSTMATAGTTFANASCATPALAADTAYQVRVKSQCAGAGSFGYLIVAARMIIR